MLLAERLLELSPIKDGKVFLVCQGVMPTTPRSSYFGITTTPLVVLKKRKLLAEREAITGSHCSGSLTGLPAFHKEFDLPIPGVFHITCPHYYSEALEGESEAEFVDRLVESWRI